MWVLFIYMKYHFNYNNINECNLQIAEGDTATSTISFGFSSFFFAFTKRVLADQAILPWLNHRHKLQMG
jgi:hypothetical protein